jgi:hypothetical protein
MVLFTIAHFEIVMKITAFICFVLIKVSGVAQSADTLFLEKAKTNTIRLYSKNPFAYANLVNGREYEEYRPVQDEHPYFFREWVEGKIECSGALFEDVSMLYDLSTDEVVIEEASGRKLTLTSSKVGFFELKGHRFEYFRTSGFQEGFYEVLYSGTIKLLSRRNKSRQEKLTSNTKTIVFEEKVRYYLLKEGNMTTFSNRKSLVKELSGGDPQSKKKLASAARSVFSNKEDEFIQVARVYDQIRRK